MRAREREYLEVGFGMIVRFEGVGGIFPIKGRTAVAKRAGKRPTWTNKNVQSDQEVAPRYRFIVAFRQLPAKWTTKLTNSRFLNLRFTRRYLIVG